MLMTFGLSDAQARFARLVGALLLIAAVLALASTPVRLWVAAPWWHCDTQGCVSKSTPLAVAPDAARDALTASPAALQRFSGYLSSWPVRAGLVAIDVFEALPFAALTAFAGLAMRRLGRRSPKALRQALPWGRRASYAAVAVAIATPVAQSLRTMLLLPGTPLGRMWWIEIEFISTGQNLLLAFAAVVLAWAIAAGSRAEREAAGFI